MSKVDYVISHLRNVTGRRFSHKSKGTSQLIEYWLLRGHSVDDFVQVIDYKTMQWKNSENMREWLKPSTLFSKHNFKRYLKEAEDSSHKQISKENGTV